MRELWGEGTERWREKGHVRDSGTQERRRIKIKRAALVDYFREKQRYTLLDRVPVVDGLERGA